MEIKDYVTLGISILALGVSLSSIYLARKWSVQARQSERREPFYKDLRKMLDFAYRTFIVGELTVYIQVSFQEQLKNLADDAHLLGLPDIENHLKLLSDLLDRMNEYQEDHSYIESQLQPSVESTVYYLIDATETGIAHLNYKDGSRLGRLRT